MLKRKNKEKKVNYSNYKVLYFTSKRNKTATVQNSIKYEREKDVLTSFGKFIR